MKRFLPLVLIVVSIGVAQKPAPFTRECISSATALKSFNARAKAEHLDAWTKEPKQF